MTAFSGSMHDIPTLEIEDLYECSCFIEIIKRVWAKRLNARHAEHFTMYLFLATSLIIHVEEHECYLLFII